MSNTLLALRQEYHRQIGLQIVRFSGVDPTYPNFADSSSRSSIAIAKYLCDALQFDGAGQIIAGQRAGDLFESLTCQFLTDAFQAIQHLRPGRWDYRTAQTTIANFVQYQHLSTLETVVKANRELEVALGRDYIIKPDIVIARAPVSESEINSTGPFVDESLAKLTEFRASNQPESNVRSFLHASISCKWTIRSDRAQNTRTEALNLMRNRKGPLPHVVAVTAEPLPMRIASLALGTGDLDCVYHFALHELQVACAAAGAEDQLDTLVMMVEGKRLRDISDLPFDLAV